MNDLNEGCIQNKNVLTVWSSFVLNTCVFDFLQPNKSFYLSKRRLFRRHQTDTLSCFGGHNRYTECHAI